jgi:uncharacterized repeat protein (TIGR03803 family)
MKCALPVLLCVLACPFAICDSTDSVLHNFPSTPKDGLYPWAALVSDGNGHFYGTTSFGGAYIQNALSGTVFEITQPQAPGEPWSERIIYSFTGQADGAYPTSTLVFGKDGSLYGTASGGGNLDACINEAGCGVIFKLTPSPGSSSWTQEVLYTFQNQSDGWEPIGGVVFDEGGNLYGTATLGGFYDSAVCGFGCGTVYELSHPTATQPSWAFTTLYTFKGQNDGSGPWASLLLNNGCIYGTNGSLTFAVTAFEICPSVAPTFTTLASFPGGANSEEPVGGLSLGSDGTLYGTVPLGGANQWGFVYEIPVQQGKSAGTHSVWGKPETIYNFQGSNDGGEPSATLLVADNGSLIGTTGGGAVPNGGCYNGCGSVYRLASSGNSWKLQVLHDFGGPPIDGGSPLGGVIPGPGGSYLGLTYFGAPQGYGVVFEAEQ